MAQAHFKSHTIAALTCWLAMACTTAGGGPGASQSVADAAQGDSAVTDVAGKDADTAGSSDIVTNPGTGAPATSTALRTAQVTATSYSAAGSGQVSGAVIAQFFDQDPSPFQTVEETFGPCVTSTSTTTASTAFPKYASAGIVTFASSIKTVNLPPVASGYDPFSTQDTKLWTGGEDLVFQAPGDVVGSFAVHLTAPDHVVVSQPQQIMGTTPTIPRNVPLAWTWTGKTAGVLEVVIQGPQSQSQQTYVGATCRFPAADGHGEIPAAVLQKFNAGDSVFLIANAVSDATVTAGNYGPIEVRAESAALASDGFSQYANAVVFQ